jgi:hypothetical protein
MEKLVEWTVLAGETDVLGENLPRRHFVHHKSHLPDPAAVGSQRLTASAMALPLLMIALKYQAQKNISLKEYDCRY